MAPRKQRATAKAPARHLAAQASEAARLLGMLGNARRLLILCQLTEHKEMTVGDLADAVGLSQSALSQHLTKMRREGLVTFRRHSQQAFYRIADSRLAKLLATIERLYCE